MNFFNDYKIQYTKTVKNLFKKSEKNQKLFLSFYDIVFLNKDSNLKTLLDLEYDKDQLKSIQNFISKLFLIVLRDYSSFLLKDKSVSDELNLFIQKIKEIDYFFNQKSEDIENEKHITIDNELLQKLQDIEGIFNNLEDNSENDSTKLLEIAKSKDLKIKALILIQGIPAKFEVEVISMLSDKIILKTNSKNSSYNKAVNMVNIIYLLTPISKKVIIGKCIESKGFIHFTSYKFLKFGSPFDRKSIKLNLIHENLDITIKDASGEVLAKILDISMNSMSTLIKKDIDIKKEYLYKVEFVLDSKIMRMDVKCIKTIKFDSYKIIVFIFNSKIRAFENILNGFMHRKQLEIIDKLKHNTIETNERCLI